ncbi:Mu transposase C-terminal domain-containing protein [Tsukamurella pseudospumae]|uniref:Integrase n=1 Tax=Tsukamurella pseudospumae TaxID=239498 RepID=A0A137ZSY2_9ACTN|nr:Mu transposase C-terminal domain-containing protein [Tsukamurella pseudospumae]KXP01296.1 integrase [Tsukamurella pseudospumae]
MRAGDRQIRMGSRVRFRDHVYDVAGTDGSSVFLTGVGGAAPLTISATDLLVDRTFSLESAEGRPIAPPALFDLLPVDVRDVARDLERHITEVLDGVPLGSPAGTRPRPGYDVTSTTLRQREMAKVAELKAAGGPVTSLRMLQRRRTAYQARGVLGLVDRRSLQRRNPAGRTDPRVIDALLRVLEANTHGSSGTVDRIRRAVVRDLEETHPGESVPVPSMQTFYRMLSRLAEGRHATGSARTRRTLAQQPDGPFSTVRAIRPGELTQIDSTPLDVAVILADGVIGRVELTALVDVATRTIGAAVLRPTTKAADAALLLARAMTPEPMRPGWSEAVRMTHSALPYHHLVEIDERLRDAAARPVIVPETIVFDHGKVFVSDTFRSACRTLGISLQPAHQDTPTDKPIVERTIQSIGTLFAQHVVGYLGSSVERRGRTAEQDAAFTVLELQNLLDEWIVTGWQNRRHDGLRNPLVAGEVLTPNEKYAALLSVAGYVPVPLSDDDYIRLLPTCSRVINSYGIKIDHRIYDCEQLNPLRRQKSPIGALNGRWLIHYDPYDVSRVWIRTPEDDAWITAYWRQLHAAPQPFGRDAWEHGRRIVADRGAKVTEQAITEAVDSVLNRAATPDRSPGSGRRRRRDARIAARTTATTKAQLVPLPSPAAAPPARAKPTLDDEEDEVADVIPLPVFDPESEAKSWW